MNQPEKKRPSAKRRVDLAKQTAPVSAPVSTEATAAVPATAQVTPAIPAVELTVTPAVAPAVPPMEKPEVPVEKAENAKAASAPKKKENAPTAKAAIAADVATMVASLSLEAENPPAHTEPMPTQTAVPTVSGTQKTAAQPTPQAKTQPKPQPKLQTKPQRKPSAPTASTQQIPLHQAKEPPKQVILTPENDPISTSTLPTTVSEVAGISFEASDMSTAPFFFSEQEKEQTMPKSTRQKDSQSAVRGIDYEYVDRDAVISKQKKPVGHTASNSKGGKGTQKGRPAAKSGKKPTKKQEKDSSGAVGGTVIGVLKALLYMIFVFAAAGVLSYFAISVGNDVFALVKSDAEYTLTIPENATIDDVAKVLAENEIIKYPTVFKIYSMLRKDNGNFVAGTYQVTPAQDYDDLLYAFKPQKPKRTEVSVTIPEGYTVNDIIELFVSKGMGTKEGFADAVQNYDFDFWFVKELNGTTDPSRPWRLEGYLFPDTYYFYSDASEETILYKMLSNFNAKFPESYKDRCEALGMTVDEVITLASMIQMEAKYADEYGKVSSVFHNRLNNPTVTNGKLESDATIQYAFAERKTDLTDTDMEIDSPYNTYLYNGLPPGPISNPSLNAINWAMYPDDTDYFYFIATKTGRSLFAETLAEHNKNVATVKADN